MNLICGVDEAGCGPLAGAVYAAAVILDDNNPILGKLTDSKKLSAKLRDTLYDEIIAKALAYSIAYVDVEEIDKLNILRATLLAMKKAVDNLSLRPDTILIDGLHKPDLDIQMQTIVKGDILIKQISAASILAKVTRDREMIELDKKYPGYGFLNHKGYGTKEHLNAIKSYGILPIHRKSFSPINQYLEGI